VIWPQRQRRPPGPVAPLPRGRHPDPRRARPRPHAVRVHHPPRQPGPPGAGKPLHQGPRVRAAKTVTNAGKTVTNAGRPISRCCSQA